MPVTPPTPQPQPMDADELEATVDQAFRRCRIATTGPEDMAFAEMLVTHEDDLPKA